MTLFLIWTFSLSPKLNWPSSFFSFLIPHRAIWRVLVLHPFSSLFQHLDIPNLTRIHFTHLMARHFPWALTRSDNLQCLEAATHIQIMTFSTPEWSTENHLMSLHPGSSNNKFTSSITPRYQAPLNLWCEKFYAYLEYPHLCLATLMDTFWWHWQGRSTAASPVRSRYLISPNEVCLIAILEFPADCELIPSVLMN